MSQEKGLAKGLIVGFITGAAVGSIIALLYAPKSGKELRQDIMDKSDELKSDLDKQYRKAKEKVSDIIQEGKIKSERLVENTKEKLSDWVSETEKAFDGAKSKTISEKEKLSGAVKAGWEAGLDEYKKI